MEGILLLANKYNISIDTRASDATAGGHPFSANFRFLIL